MSNTLQSIFEEHDVVDRKVVNLPTSVHRSLIGQNKCLLYVIILVLRKSMLLVPDTDTISESPK